MIRRLAIGWTFILLAFASTSLQAQSKLVVKKGSFYLKTKGLKTQKVNLRDRVVTLRNTSKGLRLQTIKKGVKPEVKALERAKSIQFVSGKKLAMSLSKDVVKWKGTDPSRTVKVTGEHSMVRDPEMIFHGDQSGNIYVIPECLVKPITVRDGTIRILGKDLGKIIVLGLSPEFDGQRSVLACGSIGVGVDILDNIDDPALRYRRMADDFFGRTPEEGNFERDAEGTLESWASTFCSEFELDSRSWELPNSGYHLCKLDLETTSLALDCDGNLLVTRGERQNLVDLSTCPLILSVLDDNVLTVVSQDPDCLSVFDCQ